ncbi:MAG: hypothetical protein J6U01_10100, partial [Clostridia bacterium]|nr:hypothetical protein [Clostridia bacterium]
LSLPTVPSWTETTQDDSAPVFTNEAVIPPHAPAVRTSHQEPAVNPSGASRSSSSGSGRSGALSSFFPYRRFLLMPQDLVFPRAGLLRWSSRQQPDKGGLFGSFFTRDP